MSMLTLTFHGHACFTLEADGHRLVIDPFLVVLAPGQTHTLS